MVNLVDLLLDQTFGFIFNAFWWGRRHNHLVIIMVWVILQRVLSISQAPMFKVNIIFLCFRDNRERVFPWRNSINFLCYAIDSAPGATAKWGVLRGPTFAMIFSNPLFHQSILTFPTSPPAIPCFEKWRFLSKSPSGLIGVITKAGLRVFFNEDFPQLLAKCQEHRNWSCCFPGRPLMSRWSQDVCQVRMSFFLEVFWGFLLRIQSPCVGTWCRAPGGTAISPTGFAPGFFRFAPLTQNLQCLQFLVGHAISKETTHLDHRCCAMLVYAATKRRKWRQGKIIPKKSGSKFTSVRQILYEWCWCSGYYIRVPQELSMRCRVCASQRDVLWIIDSWWTRSNTSWDAWNMVMNGMSIHAYNMFIMAFIGIDCLYRLI